MASPSTTGLTIYEQRLQLLERHHQERCDLSASLATSRHELHQQHRQQRCQLVDPTPLEYQVLLREQVDRLRERQQTNQVLRVQLRAKQKEEWVALNIALNSYREYRQEIVLF